MTTLRHVAGSVFGLLLSTTQSPIVDPTGLPISTAGWGVKLRLVGASATLEIEGQWLNTEGPWSLSFEDRATLPWPVQTYAARLAYTEPAPDSRLFEVETPIRVEVLR